MQYELPLRTPPPPKYEPGAAWSRWQARGSGDHNAFLNAVWIYNVIGLLVLAFALPSLLFPAPSEQLAREIRTYQRVKQARLGPSPWDRRLYTAAHSPDAWCYRVSRGAGCPRSTGRSGSDFAFFEAFPASGVGTSGACSTTAPTGAKGEALTFTRASTATCTKTATGGLTATGIAVGDLVSLSNNVARVEYDSNGVLGLLVESSGANSLLRSEEIENVAWTSTATVTANAATPPQTTGQISNAEQLSDASAVAFQGSCQTISTTSATQHTFYAYVRAGTATGAQVTMTGVGSSTGDCTATKSGLSGTTWDILGCSSPAAYGALLTSVMVCVNVGTVVADTGTVMAWGADYKVSAAYRTSYIPTAGAGGARAAEPGASTTLASAVGPSGCIAASVTWSSASVGAVNIASLGVAGAGTNMTLYRTSNTAAGYQIGGTTSAPAVSAIGTTTHRTVLADNAGTRTAYWDAVSVTAPAASMSGGQTPFQIGATNGGGVPVDGIVSRVQVDPTFTRCTP